MDGPRSIWNPGDRQLGGTGGCLQGSGWDGWNHAAIGVLMMRYLFIASLLTGMVFAQAWSGILSPTRAIDWTKAGLPATFPDGETTPDPWSPPTRTLCTTVTGTNSSADATNIQNAIIGCAAGTYVSLVGTFNITTSMRIGGSNSNGHNYVTLRGQGPMSTTLNLSAGNLFVGAWSFGGGGALTSANFPYTAQQTTQVVHLQNVTDSASLIPNNVAVFVQCDNGWSPVTPGQPLEPESTSTGNQCTGTYSDPGTTFHCGNNAACSSNAGGGNQRSEYQVVRIISATNTSGSNWDVTVSPGLYMPDFSTTRGATLEWNGNNGNWVALGMGIEDMTILVADNATGVQLGQGYADWIKGVRFVGYNNSNVLNITHCSHCLAVSNYFFGNDPHNNTFLGNTAYSSVLQDGQTGETLFLNNINQQGTLSDDFGWHQGFVMAYNFSRDVITSHYQSTQFEHQPGSTFFLREGNEFGRINDDNTDNTHNLNTYFRNNLNCGDTPYDIAGHAGGGLLIGPYARFENVIGNVIGIGMPSKCPAYVGQATDGNVFNVNGGTNPDNTGLTLASLLRWGNYVVCSSDSTSGGAFGTHCNKASFDPAEIPSNLSSFPNSVSPVNYQNSVPANNNLPCSLFMPNNAGQGGTTCTPKYSGGTGIEWWKVCDTWATFPTSCAHFTIPPFPPAGPDITNLANDNPAAVAWKNLPIDTSYQNTYAITASSWSSASGGVESLTVTGLPQGEFTMGAFQITGACAGTPSTGINAAGEFLMTNGPSDSVPGNVITYAISSNPGNCVGGNILWPDVRQFDERVYTLDPAGNNHAHAPGMFAYDLSGPTIP